MKTCPVCGSTFSGVGEFCTNMCADYAEAHDEAGQSFQKAVAEDYQWVHDNVKV